MMFNINIQGNIEAVKTLSYIIIINYFMLDILKVSDEYFKG